MMRLRLRFDLRGYLCNNFWWKIAALIAAVIIWVIVRGDPTQGIKI